MSCFPGWPYAAKGVVQHEFDTDHLNIWLTFTFPMNQTVMPDLSKWVVKCDGIEKTVTSSVWQDAFTLLLIVPEVSADPNRVLLAYKGPGPEVWLASDPARKTLEIMWQKQWEPWGPILSLDITT
jgi:hypothetical protein